MCSNSCANDVATNLDTVKEKANTIDVLVDRGSMISTEISTMVGLAINPLLGMVVVGAFENYKATINSEPIQWYNSLWFLIPAFLMLVIIIMKDTICEAFPPLKQFLDGLELVEHKVFAILAFSSRVPFIVDVLNEPLSKSLSSMIKTINPVSSAFAATQESIAVSLNAGMVDIVKIIAIIAIVSTCAVIFFIVWLSSGTVETLTFISPIPFTGLFLKLLRLFLLVNFTILTLISPFLGLIASLIIIYISYKIAGWSFRLSVFGIILFYDVVTFKWTRVDIDSEEHIYAFSSKGIEEVKNRSYGKLICEKGTLIFNYKPFFIFPKRSIALHEGIENIRIAKGLLHPSIIKPKDEENSYSLWFHLRPMYRNHEVDVAEKIGLLSEVHQLWALSKIKDIWKWIRDQFSEDRFMKSSSSQLQ